MAELPAGERIAYRTCPLCEATCGLELTIRGDTVTRVRGDRDDVFSRGYLCPKGVALGELHADPDRLRAPLIRDGDAFRVASWPEAYAAVAAGLAPILARGDRDAVAIYGGNPLAHNMESSLYLRPLVKAVGSRNFYTSSTVDQMPRHLVAGLMFGDPMALAVPDIDRMDYLLMLGANPWESNGSLWTAPNLPARLRLLRRRGGRLVVVDPRRTRTARHADQHLAIRPGSDAPWLLALINVILADDLARPGRLATMTSGLDGLAAAVAPFTPEAVAALCGITPDVTRQVAHALAASPAAAVYARFGAQATRSGTLVTWATEVLNILTGNLDREGGVMFPRAVHERVRGTEAGAGFKTGRWRSRVRGFPEVMSEFPGTTLPDEIETPGAGQVRALLTIAGNPVLSNPDGQRLDRALGTLEFMVSVDIYLNETTRHADVILPPPSPLEHSHYDLLFNRFAVREVANYSAPVLSATGPSESEILARLALIAGGRDLATPTAVIDEAMLDELIAREIANPHSSIADCSPAEIRAAVDGDTPGDRILDFMLRTGPRGDGFGRDVAGLSLARLREAPHGVDFGPLASALPARIRTRSGRIELNSTVIDDELARVRRELSAPPAADALLLVGRREFQSNNSWLHNLPSLIGEADRCVLQMHPQDAARRGLQDGATVRLGSATGAVEVPLAITDEVAPGVVSLPHGYGHAALRVRLARAQRWPGASYNDVVAGEIDQPSGNAVLNAVPVTVAAV